LGDATYQEEWQIPLLTRRMGKTGTRSGKRKSKHRESGTNSVTGCLLGGKGFRRKKKRGTVSPLSTRRMVP